MMNKMMMKVFAVAMALSMLLGGAALAEEVVLLETETVETVQQDVYHRVTFYDFYGNEIGFANIREGSWLEPVDFMPMLEGYDFAHWFDGMDETMSEYLFGQPITGTLNLYPFFMEQAQVVSFEETVAAPVQEDVFTQQDIEIVAASILGEETTTDTSLEDMIAAMEQEQAPVQDTQNAMNDEQAAALIEQILGNVDTTIVEETVEEVTAQDIVEQSSLAMSDEAAENLVNDLLNTAGVEEEVVDVAETTDEVANDTADLIETEDEVADDELFTIEDDIVPLAAPKADPYVLVTYEYEGMLTVGTEVTVRATLYNVPETTGISYQWQNNAGGSMQDVAGATGAAFTFIADADSNTDCTWQVNVLIAD